MRYRFEYAAFSVVRFLIKTLPRKTSLKVGVLIGKIFYYLHTSRRKLAGSNLKAAFPTYTKNECDRVLRSTFEHLGRQLVELLNFDRMSKEEMLGLLDVTGKEHVDDALAKGKAVMFYSGHIGYWELFSIGHGLLFKPTVIVARTLDNPLLENVVAKIRTRLGTRVLPRQGAIRGLLKALLKKETVAMMIDQHMHDRSAVTVKFFNRPASTTSALAALALRTGAVVIPVFTLPLSGGRYRLIYEKPVKCPEDDDPDPVRTYTQSCTDVLEMYVRQYPNLWLWMHRRWRMQHVEHSG